MSPNLPIGTHRLKMADISGQEVHNRLLFVGFRPIYWRNKIQDVMAFPL